MKWSPTDRPSHFLMMSPCLMEQGIGRTSMTLSVLLEVVVVLFVCIIFQSDDADTREGAGGFGHHRRVPRRVPDDFDNDIRHTCECLLYTSDAADDLLCV